MFSSCRYPKEMSIVSQKIFWMVSKTLFEILYLFASHTHDLSKARFCQIIINPLLFCFTKYRATNVKFFFCSIFFYSSESLFRINEGCLKGLISNHHHSFWEFYEMLQFLKGLRKDKCNVFYYFLLLLL